MDETSKSPACEASETSDASPGVPPEAVVSVDIDASPASVWEALTTTEGLSDWLGRGSQIGERPGDELRFNDVISGQHKRGVLDEVSPNRRLGYTWWPETAPHEATRVAISLEPRRSGTRITVVESRPLPTSRGMATATQTSASLSARACAAHPAMWHWRAVLLQHSPTLRARSANGLVVAVQA